MSVQITSETISASGFFTIDIISLCSRKNKDSGGEGSALTDQLKKVPETGAFVNRTIFSVRYNRICQIGGICNDKIKNDR